MDPFNSYIFKQEMWLAVTVKNGSISIYSPYQLNKEMRGYEYFKKGLLTLQKDFTAERIGFAPTENVEYVNTENKNLIAVMLYGGLFKK